LGLFGNLIGEEESGTKLRYGFVLSLVFLSILPYGILPGKEKVMGIKTPAPFRQMEYRWLLLQLAEFFRPKVYVEIGVKKGYTFNAMLPYVDRGVAVDIVKEPGVGAKFSNYEFFTGTSQDFASKWEGPIDFLFIDGDHRAAAVLKDFLNLFKWVTPDTGLIFLHDTYPANRELCAEGYCSDAWKAARYIREGANGAHPLGLLYEIVTLPGPWAGLSIIRRLARGKKSPEFISHGWMDSFGGIEE